MLNKPIVLVALAGLVALGAGSGAYLALRQNAAEPAATLSADEAETLSTGVAGATETDVSTSGAVDATEATVDAPTPALDQPLTTSASSPTAATSTKAEKPSYERPARAPRAPAASSPLPAVTTPGDPPPAPAPRTTRSDLPEVEGWVRTDAGASDRREPAAVPVTDAPLASVDTSRVGASLEPETRPRLLEELVVSADSVVGLQVETAVSSENAKVEDTVEARVTRDVTVGDRVAIPAGTRMRGSVVLVERGGKVKEVARLGIRFHTLVMADGLEVPVVTETIYREGKSPAGESVAKIGGAAVGGAILGAIIGGARGAAIGGSVGAAGGTAAVMASDPNPATFPVGSTVTVRLSEPVTVTKEEQ